MKYADRSYTQPYMGLYHELQNTGILEAQYPYSWFNKGYAIYVWNCEKAHGLNNKAQNEQLGNLELTGHFDENLRSSIIMIVMLTYESSYKINVHRNVIFDDKSIKPNIPIRKNSK